MLAHVYEIGPKLAKHQIDVSCTGFQASSKLNKNVTKFDKIICDRMFSLSNHSILTLKAL